MNARAMFAIARKDLKVVSQNKNVLIPIIIIIVVFFVVLPWLGALAPTIINVAGEKMAGIEDMLARMPAGMQQELCGYSLSQKMTGAVPGVHDAAPLPAAPRYGSIAVCRR